jgi:hypothetical protein
LIPIPTDVIVRSILGIALEEPEEIPPEKCGIQIAGYMDRPKGAIVVAQQHRPEWRRFTMAHEIGHWVIHPDETYHRDMPLSGGERANLLRPLEEQEADVFASELVMPRKPIVSFFERNFGSAIDGGSLDARIALWLSTNGRRLNEIDLCKDLRRRSLAVAVASSFGPDHVFVPLSKKFGVSPTAMAIRLEELGLVI